MQVTDEIRTFLASYKGANQKLLDAALDVEFGADEIPDELQSVLESHMKGKVIQVMKYDDLPPATTVMPDSKPAAAPQAPKARKGGGGSVVMALQKNDRITLRTVEEAGTMSDFVRKFREDWGRSGSGKPDPAYPIDVEDAQHETRKAVLITARQLGKTYEGLWIPKVLIGNIDRNGAAQ